jgi:hypothetical protein
MARRKRQSTRPRLKSVRVEGQRRPECDWDKYGWTLLCYAKTLAAAEAKAAKRSDQP